MMMSPPFLRSDRLYKGYASARQVAVIFFDVHVHSYDMCDMNDGVLLFRHRVPQDSSRNTWERYLLHLRLYIGIGRLHLC